MYDAPSYCSEEVEVVCQHDLMEIRVFAKITEVLDDGVLILVVKGVGYVVNDEESLLVALPSGLNVEYETEKPKSPHLSSA